LVLDNARYQHCVFIKELAATLNIRLLFLPGYSPNLNLIERLCSTVRSSPGVDPPSEAGVFL
jgi:transposase